LNLLSPEASVEAEKHLFAGYELAEQGRFGDAIAEYDDAIRLEPTYASAYNLRGLAHRNLGEHELGIQDLDEAIGLDPRMARAYYNRGGIYLRMGEYKNKVLETRNKVWNRY